jgi:hypothetical protein
MGTTTRTYCKTTTTKDSTTEDLEGEPQVATTTPSTMESTPKGVDIADTSKARQSFRLVHFGAPPCQNTRTIHPPLMVKCRQSSPQLPSAIAKCVEIGTSLPMPKAAPARCLPWRPPTPLAIQMTSQDGTPSLAHDARRLLHHGVCPGR